MSTITNYDLTPLLAEGMVQNAIEDKEPVVRVPSMVVRGNSYVRAERHELLAAGFVFVRQVKFIEV